MIRKTYYKELREKILTNKSFFGVIRGRRRIGKSYFSNDALNQEKENIFISFSVTAIKSNKNNQILNFKNKIINWIDFVLKPQFPDFFSILDKYKDDFLNQKEWLSIFNLLGILIHQLNQEYNSDNKKVVLVFDEFQWFCSSRSGFLDAFIGQWNDNGYGGFEKNNILFIACGSNTIWLEENLLKNKNGLHQRISFDFNMKPFNLKETKQFFQEVLKYDPEPSLLIDYYLITGGVAQYLNFIKPHLSFEENVNNLYYSGLLKDEFKEIFSSLFNQNEHENYEKIIDLFAENKTLNIKQLYEKLFNEELISTDNKENSNLTKLYHWIKNLTGSCFIYKKQTNNSYYNSTYCISDHFCYFYLKYVKNHSHFSIKQQDFSIWKGFALELAVLNNIDLIKEELKIFSHTEQWFWHNDKAQIDLLMERIDNQDSIIEVKYYNKEFVIDGDYLDNLNNKKEQYLLEKRKVAKRFNKNINFVIVSVFGSRPSKNISFYYHDIKLIDLI